MNHTRVSLRIHCIFADHAHILLLLPPTIPLATAVQKMKANSSRWIHEQTGMPFQWQEGYSAFSVSISQTDATVDYILHQKEHHKKRGFGEELSKILAHVVKFCRSWRDSSVYASVSRH